MRHWFLFEGGSGALFQSCLLVLFDQIFRCWIWTRRGLGGWLFWRFWFCSIIFDSLAGMVGVDYLANKIKLDWLAVWKLATRPAYAGQFLSRRKSA